MRIRGTRRARLIALVLVVATLGVGGMLLYRRAVFLYEHVGEILVDRLQELLGREVAIGRVDARHIGRVILYDVAIAEKARLSEGALLRTPRITLSYRPAEMIWGSRDVMAALTEIVVESPSGLLERDPTGDWNVAKLFRPRGPAKPSRFRGRVVVRRGQLIFRDYLTRLPRRPAVNEIRSVDGVLSFAAYPALTADVGGLVAARRGGRLQVTFYSNPPDKRWLATAQAQDADAGYWSSYLFTSPQGQIRAGRADLALTIAREGPGPINPLQFAVVGSGRRLTLTSPRLHRPLTEVTATFQADTSGLTLAGDGLLAGMSVRVQGRVLGWRQPMLAMDAGAAGVTLERVRAAFPELPASEVRELAPATLQAHVEGPATDPILRGTAHIPALAVSGVRIDDARTDWHYYQRRLQLANLTAGGAEGKLRASGWVDLHARPLQLYASGTATDLALRSLTSRSSEPLAGKVTGRFVIAGAPGKWTGAASVRARELQYGGRSVEQAVARVALDGGRIHVERLVATDPKGTLVAWGDVTPGGELALRLRAAGVDLARWITPSDTPTVSGTAFLTGELVGTARDPRLVADVDLYDTHMGELSVDFASGHVIASRSAVTFDPEKGFVARLYPAELQLRGEIRAPTSAQPELDLRATLQDLPIDRFLTAQGAEPPLSGSLSGTLSISGTPRAPRGGGNFRLEQTLVRGFRLGTLAADARLADERLEISNLRAEGERIRLAGGGTVGLVAPAESKGAATITRESPLRFTLTVDGLDLRQLNAETDPYVSLAGTLTLPQVLVEGTVGRPTVAGKLAIAPLTINGEEFTRLAAAFRWDGQAAQLSQGILDAGTGNVSIPSASYRPAASGAAPNRRQLELTGNLTTLPLDKLVAVLRNSAFLGTPDGAALLRLLARVPTDLGGHLTGTFNAAPGSRGNLMVMRLESSELRLPSVQLLTAETVQAIGTVPPPSPPLILTLQGTATYEAGLLTMPRFEMTRPGDEAQLVLRDGLLVREGARDREGNVLPQGRLQVSLDAYSLPLRMVAAFFPEILPVAGRAELHFNAQGPLRTPTIEGTADAENPVIAGIPFSRLFVPRVVLAGDSITVDGARLVITHQGHEHRLTVETPPGGAIPFSWETMGIPRNRQRRLVVRLDEQDLEVLEDLAAAKNPNPRIAPVIRALHALGGIKGQIAASVTLAGTGDTPQNTGEVRLRDVAFSLPGGQTELRNIQINLAFAGDEVRVQQFTGVSSRGGQFEVTGRIDLGRNAPAAGPLDLALKVADLEIAGRNISGTLQETIAVTMRTVGPTDPRARNTARAPVEPIHITGTFSSPLIAATGGTRGGILLTKSRLVLPAVLPEARAREENPPFNPRFEFAVIAGDDVTVRNPSLSVQLRGAVPVSGSLARPVVRGTLEVAQGLIRFPGAPPFRLAGQIMIAYAPGLEGGEVSPLRLDLTARGVTRGVDRTTGRMQRYEITLTIRGSLTADPLRLAALEQEQGVPSGLRPRLTGGGLSVQATSQPPLSELQILALLGRQSAVEGFLQTGNNNIQDVFRSEFEQMLGTSVFPSLLAPTEFRVAEALGLEEFGVEFAFREPVRVRIGKRLFDGFYGTYIRNFGAQEDQYSFELYRRVSNRLRVGYRLEEPTNNRVWLLEGSFRF
jgi:autotransporter translocation and assembly factor TamB